MSNSPIKQSYNKNFSTSDPCSKVKNDNKNVPKPKLFCIAGGKLRIVNIRGANVEVLR